MDQRKMAKAEGKSAELKNIQKDVAVIQNQIK